MRIEGLTQSSACDYVSFADADSFRHSERMGAARSIPLGRPPFDAWRALFRLPSCDLVVLEAFPRILDAEYRAEGGALYYTLEGNTDMTMNGVAMDEQRIALVQGEMSLAAVQRSRSVIAGVVLRDAAELRGWPQIQGGLRLSTVPAARLAELRVATLALFEAAVRDDASFTAISESAQETLLAIADHLLLGDELDVVVPPRSFAYHRLLVRQIDDLIDADPRAVVYTNHLSARSESRPVRCTMRSLRCEASVSTAISSSGVFGLCARRSSKANRAPRSRRSPCRMAFGTSAIFRRPTAPSLGSDHPTRPRA